MASDLGEEMDTETEISGDIRNLLPREGSVNAHGFHLGEMKVNRTKMMVRHVVKLVKFKWCVLRIFFKLSKLKLISSFNFAMSRLISITGLGHLIVDKKTA